MKMEMPIEIYSNHLNSNRMLLIILCCMLFLSVSPGNAEAEGGGVSVSVCSEADRASLLSFKGSITEDTTQIMSSWTGRDCCGGGWEGVECNPAGRVTILQLVTAHNFYMKGTLSSSLGNLPFLEVMMIIGLKQIRGPIPDSFSNLTRLTHLSLEYNSLGGNIPSGLGRLSFLQTLSLCGNRFQGQIPPTLGRLTNLVQFNLARNSLIGPIPSTFQNLGALQYLDLGFNMLSGPMPDFIGHYLQDLTYIDLSNNHLSGHMPISLFNLHKLSNLALHHNQLTGILPPQVGGLQALTSLSLSSNQLTGPIPASLSSLQLLWYLNLSANAFSDPLPRLPHLLSIDLSYNNLSLGSIPDWITSRPLRGVHLAGCQLRGNLPRLTRPDGFNSIDFSHNHFTGGISSFLAGMSSLQILRLSNNQLKFDLSEIIRLPASLSSVDVHSNHLFGSLSGILNDRTGSFLEVLDVSDNRISGGIPEFREGLSLKLLNTGSNMIAGRIPNSVSNLTQLERFDISRNRLSGSIPTSLGLLRKLEWLDVSINGLTGRIPNSLLGIAGLRHASFRANRLCGEIPQGRPFNIFPASAYVHNLCLCGKPMPPCRAKNHAKTKQGEA